MNKFMVLGSRFIAFAVISVLLVACGGGAGPVGTLSVSGVVVQDDSAGMPLEGVTVSLAGEQVVTGVDGAFLFESVSSGTKTVTAQFSGYESTSKTIDVSGDVKDVRLELTPSGDIIDVSGTNFGNLDGTTTPVGTQRIQGDISEFGFQPSVSALGSTVEAFDSYLSLERLQALVNGVVYDVRVDEFGYFNTTVPLNPGENTIQLRVYSSNGHAHVTGPVVVTADFEMLELRVLLRWDTLGDVDLHMFKRSAAEGNVKAPRDPFLGSDDEFWDIDRHIYYNNKTPQDFGVGTQNPLLDIDDTTGYGPETIIMQQIPAEGDQKYHIWVHYYNMPSSIDETNVVVDVFLDEAERASPIVERFEKTLTEDWESWYVTTITYPGGTFSHEPPAGN